MHVRVQVGHDIIWPRLGLGVVVLGTLVILAFSGDPRTRRLNTVNQALAQTEIDSDRLALLREQVNWIVRNTGLDETVYMSQSVAFDRLDVVVTEARFAEVTKASHANAIYDPSLKAIFIDSYLLEPTDLPFLGADGPAAAFNEGELGFWNTSLSFVIAHELGHHAASDRASAFFSTDWLEQDTAKVAEELAADAYALKTLAQAYADPKMPEHLLERNALFFFGLDSSGLVGAERSAGDLIGAMKAMSLMMQFSSGPYSPFHQDVAHPSFLERILLAVDQLALPPDSVVFGQSPILTEEVRRQLKAAERHFVEVHAPGPIARVAAHDGQVFVAVRDLIHDRDDNGLGKIYNMRLPEEEKGLGFDLLATEIEPVATGDDHNLWIEEQLALRAPGVGTLGLASEAGIVPELRLFEPYDEYEPGGFAFVDYGWFPSRSGTKAVVTDAAAKAAVQIYFDTDDIELGKPIAHYDGLIFPVHLRKSHEFQIAYIRALEAGPNARELVILGPGSTLSVSETGVLVDTAPMEFRAEFSPQDGWIDIEGARWTGRDWIVPVRASGESTAYVWELHRGGGKRPWIMQSRERLLADFIAATGAAPFGRDLDPSSASLLVLNPDAALTWYDQDTVWLSTPETTKPVFHPAVIDLRITRVDETRALFWISNATKAYLIEIEE